MPGDCGGPTYQEELRDLRLVELLPELDALYLRLLRAENAVDGHWTELHPVLWLRAEWDEVEERIGFVVDELTRRAEAAHTPEEVEAAVVELDKRQQQS